jgi:ribosomal protein S18 acetylase RimI-like enzyme
MRREPGFKRALAPEMECEKGGMKDLSIRPIEKAETPLLEEFLYQAVFRDEGAPTIPRDVLDRPEVAVYIENYGKKPDDNCLVSELGGEVVGAVWVRLLNGAVKEFGNIDDSTPELAISVLPEYRNRGIGTELMGAMMVLLREKGYPLVSLSVQKANYAVRLYRYSGFEIIMENDENYIMTAALG